MRGSVQQREQLSVFYFCLKEVNSTGLTTWIQCLLYLVAINDAARSERRMVTGSERAVFPGKKQNECRSEVSAVWVGLVTMQDLWL